MLAFNIGNMLMFMAGTALTWSSPELPKLTNSTTSPFGRGLSDEEVTSVSSLITLGAAIGPFIFCYLADKMGRKYTLLSSGVPFLVCFLMMAFGRTVELFYVARFLIGLAVGGVFTLMPIYAAELSEKSNRGIMGSLVSCAVCSGFLFSYALGPYVNVMIFNSVLAIFPGIFLVLFAFLGTEVPHYYVSINEDVLAKEALQKLRGDSDIDEELNEIQMKFKDGQSSIFDLFRSKGIRKAFITSVGLLIFQQFSGINVVFFYSQKIFSDVGAKFSPEICTIIVGTVQFLSSFIAPIIGEKFGRKNILTFSALAMALSESSLGVYSYLQEQGVNVQNVSYFPIISMTCFIASYNTGYGPLPWVMLGELFPSKAKSTATPVVSAVNWTLAFFITKYFHVMLDLLGMAGYFWFFSGCCIIAAVFAKFYVVETQGKSLQEIQNALER